MLLLVAVCAAAWQIGKAARVRYEEEKRAFADTMQVRVVRST
jgi:hypothetical protein